MKPCSRCGGHGFVPKSDNPSVYVPCECNLKAFEIYRLESAGMPRRLIDRTLESYHPNNSSQSRALKRARDMVRAYPEVEKGLCLVGPTGVGKTHLIVGILKELMQQGARVRFVDCNDLLYRLKRSYDGASSEREADIIGELQNVEVLALDDIRTHRNVEWAHEIYFSVINGRYNLGRLTFITANLSYAAPPVENDPINAPLYRERQALAQRSIAEQLREILTHRIFSRVCEMCDILHVTGDDWRMRGTVVADSGEGYRDKRTADRSVDIQPPVDFPDED